LSRRGAGEDVESDFWPLSTKFPLVVLRVHRCPPIKRGRAIECGVKPVFVGGSEIKTNNGIAHHVFREVVASSTKHADAEVSMSADSLAVAPISVLPGRNPV
jgi:hypothetical protein